jgi:hypothetical protein
LAATTTKNKPKTNIHPNQRYVLKPPIECYESTWTELPIPVTPATKKAPPSPTSISELSQPPTTPAIPAQATVEPTPMPPRIIRIHNVLLGIEECDKHQFKLKVASVSTHPMKSSTKPPPPPPPVLKTKDKSEAKWDAYIAELNTSWEATIATIEAEVWDMFEQQIHSITDHSPSKARDTDSADTAANNSNNTTANKTLEPLLIISNPLPTLQPTIPILMHTHQYTANTNNTYNNIQPPVRRLILARIIQADNNTTTNTAKYDPARYSYDAA